MREEMSWVSRKRWKGRAGYSEGFRLLVFSSAAMVNECVGNECVYKQWRVVSPVPRVYEVDVGGIRKRDVGERRFARRMRIPVAERSPFLLIRRAIQSIQSLLAVSPVRPS